MLSINLEIISSFFASIIIYNIYASKDVKSYITIIVISVFFLTFLNLILLPLDIYIVK